MRRRVGQSDVDCGNRLAGGELRRGPRAGYLDVSDEPSTGDMQLPAPQRLPEVPHLAGLAVEDEQREVVEVSVARQVFLPVVLGHRERNVAIADGERGRGVDPRAVDRKSTRLNSSHLGISYAVFRL